MTHVELLYIEEMDLKRDGEDVPPGWYAFEFPHGKFVCGPLGSREMCALVADCVRTLALPAAA